jgi:predicted mannosyl-3-phosphoglycerate phosphatase (HAD superfamily)
MSTRAIHQCQCDKCQQEGDRTERMIHHQINVVMSRLDEQQRRWYAAVEANRHSHKGVELVSKITGLDEKTIRRGQAELAEDLINRPEDRVRLPGAGRPAVEKKIQPSNRS